MLGERHTKWQDPALCVFDQVLGFHSDTLQHDSTAIRERLQEAVSAGIFLADR